MQLAVTDGIERPSWLHGLVRITVPWIRSFRGGLADRRVHDLILNVPVHRLISVIQGGSVVAGANTAHHPPPTPTMQLLTPLPRPAHGTPRHRHLHLAQPPLLLRVRPPPAPLSPQVGAHLHPDSAALNDRVRAPPPSPPTPHLLPVWSHASVPSLLLNTAASSPSLLILVFGSVTCAPPCLSLSAYWRPACRR
jgi:hypothetical protein